MRAAHNLSKKMGRITLRRKPKASSDSRTTPKESSIRNVRELNLTAEKTPLFFSHTYRSEEEDSAVWGEVVFLKNDAKGVASPRWPRLDD